MQIGNNNPNLTHLVVFSNKIYPLSTFDYDLMTVCNGCANLTTLQLRLQSVVDVGEIIEVLRAHSSLKWINLTASIKNSNAISYEWFRIYQNQYNPKCFRVSIKSLKHLYDLFSLVRDCHTMELHFLDNVGQLNANILGLIRTNNPNLQHMVKTVYGREINVMSWIPNLSRPTEIAAKKIEFGV